MALSCHFPFSNLLLFRISLLPFSIFFTSLQSFFTSLQQFVTSFRHLFYFPLPCFKFPYRVPFLLPFTIYFISLESFLLLLRTIFCTSLHHFLYSPSEIFYFTAGFLSIFLLPFRVFLQLRLFTTLFIYIQCFLLPFKVLLFFYFPSAIFYCPSACLNSFYSPSVFS